MEDMNVLEVIAEALYVSYMRRHAMADGAPEWADIEDDHPMKEEWRSDAVNALGYDPRRMP